MRKREATKKNVKPDSVELLLRLPASRSINCAAEKETFSAEDDLSDARQTCLADKRDIPGTPKGHANAAPEQQLIKATAKRREHKVTSHKRLTTPTQRMRIRMQMAKTFFFRLTDSRMFGRGAKAATVLAKGSSGSAWRRTTTQARICARTSTRWKGLN